MSNSAVLVDAPKKSSAIGSDAQSVEMSCRYAIQTFIGYSLYVRGWYQGRLSDRFNELKDKWMEDTMFSSSVEEIASDSSYLEIIRLGWPMVPLILHDLQESPKHWFYALQSITGESPISQGHEGDVLAMAQDWIEWGKVNDII